MGTRGGQHRFARVSHLEFEKQRSQSQGSKAHDLYYAKFLVVAAIINVTFERVQVWLGGGVPEGDVVGD